MFVSLFIRILWFALRLSLTASAVHAPPLRLLSIPRKTEVIDFAPQRLFAFRPLPRDIAQAVTMSAPCMFCVFVRQVSAKSRTRPFRPLSVGSGLD